MASPMDISNQLDKESGIKRTNIHGREYAIKLMPALPAYLLGVEIMETLLPTLGSATDNEMNMEDIFPEDRAMFTQLASYLVKSLKDLDKTSIIGKLLEGTTCGGQPLDMVSGMRGQVSDLAFLVEFSLRENFTDFFIEYIKERATGLPNLIKAVMPQGAAPEGS